MSSTRTANARHLDATAANLISVYEKVLQILRGEIPLPEVVELFITNYCEFACPFCRCARYHGNRSQHLSLTLLEQLLADLNSRGLKTIEFGGGGEPLLHPDISEILSHLVQRGFRLGLITNGYALTRDHDLIDLLLQCGDWVRFSVDAVSEDAYRRVHGRDDVSYGALREVIIDAARRVRSKPRGNQWPKIGMKLIVQCSNAGEIVAAVDEALHMGIHYLQFKWLEDHPWSIPPKQRPRIVEALMNRVEQVPAQSLVVDMLPGYGGPSVHERCLMSVLHPLVDWDGTIYLCAFFHHRKESHWIGNLNHQGFFESWGSPQHRERIQQVNPLQCVANCPLLRYNPVIEFIRDESFRFRYI